MLNDASSLTVNCRLVLAHNRTYDEYMHSGARVQSLGHRVVGLQRACLHQGPRVQVKEVSQGELRRMWRAHDWTSENGVG